MLNDVRLAMTSSPAPPARILQLDGLRGIAILLVISLHYLNDAAHGAFGSLLYRFGSAFRLGWIGVDLFFVLSGFLIGGILLDAGKEEHFRTFISGAFESPIYTGHSSCATCLWGSIGNGSKRSVCLKLLPHPLHGVSEQFSIDGGQRSIYGLSKLIADAACQEYAQAYELPIVVNRFGVISGPGQFGHTDQGWVVWWAIAHWLNLPLTYLGWEGKQVRDVLFVEDMLALLDAQIPQMSQFRGEVFNLGGGAANAISLCEAAQAMREISSRSTAVSRSDEARKGDIVLYWTDNRKAALRLGWQPRIDLRTGFAQIFDWIRTNETQLREQHAK